MASEKFTRDEAILALDVLYLLNKKVSADSPEMIELSKLLNRLPIYPVENRRSDFRSATGIAKQLSLFKRSCNTGERIKNVGNIFFDVAFEFEGHEDELHKIALAIRRNEDVYHSLYGSINENAGFPEGVLLGHLHCLIEQRDGVAIPENEHCSICGLQPNLYYSLCGSILQQHLFVHPIDMDWNKKYKSNNFITVCPNCHEALHRSRPWLTIDNTEKLLK